MSCAGSERVESNKGFDCGRNMGEVLGKECEKEKSLTQSVEDLLREETEGAASSRDASESDSDKEELSGPESDEDLSWLLPINTVNLGSGNCKCEGCSKLFESYNSDKENAKLLLSSWKEFRNYIRNIYLKSPFEFTQKNDSTSLKNNEKLHEIIQVMRLCDPYQLFQKIEDELCSMVLQSRVRQLNLLKDESNPALAEEFITGLIAEYVKLLTSALQLSPAIENLLGPQLQKFGLTWEVLNKQLYRSLVYNHFDVQQNLVRFIEQLRKMLPFKDDIYHELVHQYLALDREMTLIGAMWKNVEPLIQEYRNLKSKENEKLNNLLDAMKDFFANKLCTEEDELDEANEKNPCSSPEDGVTFCSKDFMPGGGGCPCDDCCLSHLMSCKDILLGMESPVGTNTPSRSRSRSPIKQTESEPKFNSRDGDNSEEQSCECHACTVPPSDLMDCSAAFDQSRIKSNTHGEGFQLYPHIHGTKSEAKDVSDLFGSLQKNADLVYPHLYNLNSHETSCPALNTEAQLSNIISSQVTEQSQNSNKVVSQCQSLSSETSASEALKSSPSCINSGKEASSVNGVNLSAEKLASIKKSIEESRMTEERSKVNDGNSESVTVHKGIHPSEKGEKSNGEKPLGKTLNNVKGNGCVISGICGKCCLKHGTNCAKMPGCTKGTGSPHGGKAPVRCVGGGKDECVHKTSKSHTCGKTKPDDKKALNKRVLDGEPLSGHEDSCSESSNATSVNTQKDPRHCDCCYCEVFGHGMPSVAPVSRNYQEMRDRLRLRLKMKRSVKCKTLQQVPSTTGQNVDKGGSSQGAKKTGPEGDDLESLLKYIEGGKKDDGKSSKKAAKKARQKQKKQKEKQKAEEEAEKKTLEAVKNQVDISVVNNNKRSPNVKQNAQPSKIKLQPSPAPTQQQQSSLQQQKHQKPQCFNLSGLNSLIEKSDPSEVPKMVTIRRVMAPFSAEPTVTITLKGSTPDKDKVLFMLKNGSEAVPSQTNQPSKKSRRKKKKKGNNDYEEEEEVYEPEIESEPEFEYEPPAESKSKRKRRRKKRHQEEEEEEEDEEEEDEEEGMEEDEEEEIIYETKIKTSSRSKEKPKNSKVSLEQSSSIQKSSKKGTQKEVAGKSKSNKPQTTSDTKTNQQPSTKMLNQNVKNNKQTSQNNNSVSEKKNAQNNFKSNAKNSSYSSNSVSNNVNNKSDKKVENTENSNSCGKKSKESSTGKNASVKNGQKTTVNNSTKQNSNSITVNQTSKKEKAQRQVQTESKTGNGKKQKKESVQSSCDPAKHKQTNSNNSNKTDTKSNSNSNNQTSNKNTKNTSNSNSGEKNKSKEIPVQKTKVQSQKNQGLDILEKLQNKHRLPNLEITRAPDPSERARKAKVTPPLQEVEVNWKGPSDRYDKGKVVINTPSYRLSEVLSSIAPSPPPKEEINLENLRLPPGITITKIEGPIAKPVKPSVQPSQIQKPAPPIVMSTPMLKPNPQPGNVIVVDTGRLKEVIKENSQMAPSIPTMSNSKKKKKKNKQQEENMTPTIKVPISDSRFGMKVPKNCSPVAKAPISMLASMDARKMVPNLDNQQATIIKTSNNMVTIRSPALQQAMNIHAYQSSQAYKAGLNGYTNVSLFEMNEKMGSLKLSASMADAEDRLARQMRSLNLKGENRAKTEVLAHTNPQIEEISSKKKKKKKKKGKSKDEVEPVESVFQPKDIDLENGDIDDDERELEAFKRFCLQSVPSERKNKVKVNLNLKDIVLKKKSS